MTFLSLVYRKAHPSPDSCMCTRYDVITRVSPPVTLFGAKIAIVHCAILGDLLQLDPDAPLRLA